MPKLPHDVLVFSDLGENVKSREDADEFSVERSDPSLTVLDPGADLSPMDNDGHPAKETVRVAGEDRKPKYLEVLLRQKLVSPHDLKLNSSIPGQRNFAYHSKTQGNESREAQGKQVCEKG